MNGLLFDLRSVLRGWRRSPALALSAVALLAACWLPALRAGAIEPMRAPEED